MNDQERIADLLCSEKKMSANYDTFASECVNVALRDDFLNIFSRGHQTQTGIRWSRPRPARSARHTPGSPTSSPRCDRSGTPDCPASPILCRIWTGKMRPAS